MGLILYLALSFKLQVRSMKCMKETTIEGIIGVSILKKMMANKNFMKVTTVVSLVYNRCIFSL